MAAPILTEVNVLLDGVSAAMPEFFLAYQAIKAVWTLANPAKTDADFHAYLAGQSSKLRSDAGAILTADGWTRDTTGNWVKPPASS